MTVQEIRRKFLSEVAGQASDVDPEDDYDWEGLVYGYMLALGMPPDEDTRIKAYELSCELAGADTVIWA